MKFGLPDKTIDMMHVVFKKYKQIDKVVLYGSRAKGNYRNGSDIDLTLFGNDIDYKLQIDIFDDLDELLLPYMIDLSVYYDISNDKLKEHITRVGEVFYERKKELNQGWELKKLGEVCKKASSNISQNKIEKIDGIYPIYGAKGLIKHVSFYHQDKSYIGIIKDGASVGKVMIFDAFTSVIGTLQYLIPNDNIDIRYFYYFLLGMNFEKYINGSTIPHIYFKDYKEEKFLLIPLPEQQKIVSILDKAFSAIDQAKQHAEQNLKNAKELFNSYLQSIFSNRGDDWEDKNIGDICNLMIGGTPSSNKAEYYNNGEIKWLVSGDVNMIEIYDCKGRITELGLANSNTKFLPVNSVIIALNGQGKTRGTVAMLRTKATCNQSLVSIYPKDIEKLLPEFIFYNLKVRYQELRTITGDSGNDRRGLNMPLIRSISIPYPKSIQDQEKLIKTFSILSDKTKQLETIYQQKLIELQDLKKSILQKAFNGNLKLDDV